MTWSENDKERCLRAGAAETAASHSKKKSADVHTVCGANGAGAVHCFVFSLHASLGFLGVKKTSRPRVEIDQKEFEKLCGLQCTCEEIAAWFEVSVDSVRRWCRRTYKADFTDVWTAKSARGRISLRRTQFRLADRYPAMAIFLGKNYLGQSDRVMVEDKAAIERLDEILKGTHENAVELQRQAE